MLHSSGFHSAAFRALLAAAFAGFALAAGSSAFAQAIGGNVQGGNVQGGNVQGGNVQGGNVQGGNVQGGAAGGIKIDAQGVVTPVFSKAGSAALEKKRLEAAASESLPADVNRPSPMRKISLVKLEAACREYAEKGEPATADMQFLAGLQRIDYVFVYPEANDLVIAGPAEGYAADSFGRVIGVNSGRPPVRLDDLIVALRALQRGGTVGCSIDPDTQRLAQLREYVIQNSNTATPAVAQARYQRMRDILGMQHVRVWGVDPDTHYAEVLVEADYRMKLISLGLEQPKVRGLKSHLSLVQGGGNSMQRWWFTPLYDAFQTTEDRTAFQFAGQRAQVMSQEEQVSAGGQRSDAPFTRISTQAFGRLFTEKFSELADEEPVYAELQNLIDLAVLAALLQKERLPAKVGWAMSLFLDGEKAKVARGVPPKEVHSAVAIKRANRGLYIGLVGGGVTIDPYAALEAAEFRVDPASRLDGIRTGARKDQPNEEHPWWWD